MTLNESKKIMAILTAAYPQVSISEATIGVYITFLSDLSFEMGQAVALQLISYNKWFPSIAELRQAIVKMLPDEIPSTEEAWLEVINEIRGIGSYGSPHFSNNLISKAVNAIGWRELCLSDNPVADRAHFFRIYESYRVREIEDNLQLPEIKRLKATIQRQLTTNIKEISVYK